MHRPGRLEFKRKSCAILAHFIFSEALKTNTKSDEKCFFKQKNELFFSTEVYMKEKFEMIKTYIYDMGMIIISEDEAEQMVVVDDEENGIKNLVIDCEEPILVLEQVIMSIPGDSGDLFRRLLQMNRELVHGAFVLDEDCKYVLFRDTLQLENLDRNELEGSIHALSLALSEYGGELLKLHE